ncbi:3-methyladenine DNA glycosylase [Haloferula sargassicola]|uniref:3-methyladenine DNA glycosylase n=1 Tax=Haloferula sargassicola TaxID=490096 RepID=A0ABP9UMF9_9BACT
MPDSFPTTLLPAPAWRARLEAHARRAEALTRPALDRRAKGRPQPVEDFLFTYYSFSFGKLRQWHPGLGSGLETDGAPLPAWFGKRPYRHEAGRLFADPRALREGEAERLRWIRDLLVATRDRAPNFACFGMHEWAMVYRGTEVRHQGSAPLRLPQEEIDQLVESRPICCSHFDAFRFFTPEARPLNKLQPDLLTREAHEQPGCVHANMDLYKWAGKALPWAGSGLWLDCLDLATELRDLDMRASPYDLRAFGLEPIPIETYEGRRTYEAEQHRLAARAVPLRARLIGVLDGLLAGATVTAG